MHPKTVSSWISYLREKNYIKVELVRKENKQIIQRKILIKAKAEYYGYKQLSRYIREAAVYEKVTIVDLVGKNEILKAY